MAVAVVVSRGGAGGEVGGGGQAGGAGGPRPVVRMHTAEFMAEGVERYGRGFLRALDALARGEYRSRVVTRLPVAAPGERRVPMDEALGALERTIREFQPRRGGLTVAPWTR